MTSDDAARPPKNPYKRELAPFAQASVPRATLDLLTSVVPYFALSALMVVMLNAWDLTYWVVLPVGILAAGFLLRTYIVFHDCTHGSFLPTKRGNHVLGAIVGTIVFTPFQAWRHSHAMHHNTAGDLDRRGHGDVPTMTLGEYLAASPGLKLGYRLFRNPLIMFGLGWLWGLVIQPRLTSKDMKPLLKRSTWWTNAVLVVLLVPLCVLIGPATFFLVQGTTAFFAGSAGVFLFYVQHQFEDTYWENTETWTYADAGLRGSSYLKLPKVLQYFTGNIGLHHVHHLSYKVPNYHLQAAVDAIPAFQQVPVLTLWDGIKCSRLKVWSAEHGRLLKWSEVRALQRAMPAAGTA